MIKHARCRMHDAGCKKILLFIFTFTCLLLFAGPSPAKETVRIISEKIDYDGQTSVYTATGNVKIQKGPVTIEAAVISYNEKTSEISAEGDVRYEDPDASIKAKSAEINLETKTGKLHEAEIFYKKDNYHITGVEIIRKGEKEYAVTSAAVTTCDAPVPEWCIKSRKVDILVGDKIEAQDITFNIKDLPVLYSPYFSASLDKERKSGLLKPDFGYIKSKGVHYSQPFYWAISENRDATFLLDVYTQRGVGEGLEYRHIEQDGSKGSYFVYHLNDSSLGKDFWEMRGVYDNRESTNKIAAYLNLNYITSRDYYTEYNPYVLSKDLGFLDPATYLNRTTERFLQSTGEASLNFDNSRLYLTAQHLIDLKAGAMASTIPQRLPEIGYFINPHKIGPLTFSLNAAIANFWKEGRASEQRLDIYPRFTHSFGSDIVLTQGLGLRETAYSLRNADSSGSSPHSESFDYNISATTRFIKRYDAFVHIVEPSLGYTFIPYTNSNLPLFDSTELYAKTSTANFSIMNRFMDADGEFLTVRVSEAVDIHAVEQTFLPLRIEAALQRPLFLRGDLSVDINTGKAERINTDILISLPKVLLSVGERYSRSDDILFYAAGINYTYSKELSAEGNFWYDAKNGGLKDFMARLNYRKQCWGTTLVLTRRQTDYSISVLIDLLSLGTIKI